jgi:hypothetical protein
MASIVDPKFTKPVDTNIMLEVEKTTLKSVFESSLTYTLCDRSSTTDKKANFFSSFNLPSALSDLSTGSTLSQEYPELQQLNVDQIIFAKIPSASYSEFIDGRSIKWRIPFTGSTKLLLHSSTYTSDKVLKSESNPLLGDNIAFLFCDSINIPFTGKTIDEIGRVVNHSGNTTWYPSTNFLDKPSAVGYREVRGNSIVNGFSTDNRSNVQYSVTVPSLYPSGRSGYQYDIPVGFVILDKGYLVITHSAITQSFPWTTGRKPGNTAYSGGVNDVTGKTDIYFTGITSSDYDSEVTYRDLNTEFQMSSVCVAKPREFYISNNPTWNRELAIAELNEQTGIVNIESVYITEVGLFNALGELVAIGKMSEPIEKIILMC